MHSETRLLLLMVGASVSLGFPLGVFGGMLEGLQRFYILNWTSIGATLARAALIVYFLNRGYGLLTSALLTVGLPILSSILRGIIVFRLCRVPLGLKHVDRASFRHMANYGGTTFLVLVASRLRFRTDELVLGTMMSTARRHLVQHRRPHRRLRAGIRYQPGTAFCAHVEPVGGHRQS